MAELRLRDVELQWRAVQGEVVALDLRGSQYLGVNDSGAALWEMLVAGTTRAQLVERLRSEYDLELLTAQAHVGAFLDQLRAQDLLDEDG